MEDAMTPADAADLPHAEILQNAQGADFGIAPPQKFDWLSADADSGAHPGPSCSRSKSRRRITELCLQTFPEATLVNHRPSNVSIDRYD
jgi:hypothetical protein